MGIDWKVVEATLRKSIERNQHATGEAVPKLAQAILALGEVERRTRVAPDDKAVSDGEAIVNGIATLAGHHAED